MGILQSAPNIFVPFQCGVSQAPRMQNGANQADSMGSTSRVKYHLLENFLPVLPAPMGDGPLNDLTATLRPALTNVDRERRVKEQMPGTQPSTSRQVFVSGRFRKLALAFRSGANQNAVKVDPTKLFGTGSFRLKRTTPSGLLGRYAS
jgi:hypothetical protein